MLGEFKASWGGWIFCFGAATLLVAPPASADYSYWFPYVKAHDFMQENPFGAAASFTLTNGSFTTDTSGWNLGTGFVRHSGGYIDVGPNANATLKQARASMAVP